MGKEAVTFCAKYPEIKLVLMDLKMPGMSGLEATRKIIMQNPALTVIAQTAYTATGKSGRRLKKPAVLSFLRKPTRKVEPFLMCWINI